MSDQKLRFEHAVDLHIEDIAGSLALIHNDDLALGLIKAIDAEIADWDFTRKAWEYFDGERKKYEEEAEAEGSPWKTEGGE